MVAAVMPPIARLLFLLAGASSGLLLLGLWAVRRHTRRKLPHPSPPSDWPGISLLKPLKGMEEDLEANLRSFYAQDYPGPMEVVFAAADLDDPALPVARRVAADFPHVSTRFVCSDPAFGLNPKVANLAGALRAARHRLCLQTDANVWVEPDYLRRIVAEFLHERASLLGSLVVGRGERTPGAALENLQLSSHIAPGVCTALHVARVPCILGKSMLFDRNALESIGGLEGVRDVLCEDFVLAQRFLRNGHRVVLSPTTVYNVNQRAGLDRFVARHARWLKMRAVLHPVSFIAELAANPIALATAGLATGASSAGAWFAWAGFVGFKVLVDAHLARRLRGEPFAWRHVLLVPFKDLLMVGVWLHATCSRTVVWRGRRLRFGRGSVLRPDEGPLVLRWARRAVPR